LADRHCRGRELFCLEGAYSDAYSPLCALAVAKALVDEGLPPDPFIARWELDRDDDLTPDQDDALERATRIFDETAGGGD
jgi:hypothetical protein